MICERIIVPLDCRDLAYRCSSWGPKDPPHAFDIGECGQMWATCPTVLYSPLELSFSMCVSQEGIQRHAERSHDGSLAKDCSAGRWSHSAVVDGKWFHRDVCSGRSSCRQWRCDGNCAEHAGARETVPRGTCLRVCDVELRRDCGAGSVCVAQAGEFCAGVAWFLLACRRCVCAGHWGCCQSRESEFFRGFALCRC